MNFSDHPASSSSYHQPIEWTWEENKLFEIALTEFDLNAPNLYEKIALRMPGKTIEQIEKHYELLLNDIEAIESGSIPIPEYMISKELKDDNGTKGQTSKRKKGVPWTEEEHRLFLKGLNKHGPGCWRQVSRDFVKTRNPTQVASHAQKYFNRIKTDGARNRRRSSSLLDIRTVDPSPNPSTVNMPPSTIPLSFGPLSVYDYDESFMSYPLNGPINGDPSNALMNDPSIPPSMPL